MDTATLLSPFADALIFELVELANRDLRRVTRSPEMAIARLLRAGPDGIWVWLDRVAENVPDGWSASRDGRAWHLSAATEIAELSERAGAEAPYLPVLLPVGDDDQGCWLVPVEPGQCLPVLGVEAHALVSAMTSAVAAWSWADDIVVTHDPAVAEREARIVGPRAGHGARVLFVGDPSQLDPSCRRRCCVVTTLPVKATDLSVMVDARGASLHPLGLTVRANRIDRSREQALDELCLTAELGADGPAPSASDHVAGDDDDRVRTEAPTDSHAEVLLRGGPVEVRLLTSFPRIEGLASPINPKRTRRATELVAYLALHHPDPVTSDRLRTRVLGSADADAAAKTLFNTAGAARRALGTDTSDRPYLPPASKSGHYRVSDLVTVDAERARVLVAASRTAEEAGDIEGSMALARAALALVEGAPLDGVLTGYGWWSSEGHERRVADALVDGAGRLARLALRTGDLALGAWGLEQARMVEPYSEALSRAAMQVAAAGGDTDRVRHEWIECQRRIDELDPGSVPSEQTERLYVELRAGVGPWEATGFKPPRFPPSRVCEPQANLAAIDEAPRSTVPSAPVVP